MGGSLAQRCFLSWGAHQAPTLGGTGGTRLAGCLERSRTLQPRSRICVTGVSLGTLGSWGQGSGPRAVSTAGLGPGRHTVACCPRCLHHPRAGPKRPGREGGGSPGSPSPAAQGPRSHRCAPPTRWGQPSCHGWLRAQVSGPDTPHRMLLRRWACLPAASSLGFWSHRPGKLGRWGGGVGGTAAGEGCPTQG